MITIAIRAMWDSLRLLILAIVTGVSLAVWAVVSLGVITGGLW